MNYYGHETQNEIKKIVGEICAFFDGRPRIGDDLNAKCVNAYNLLLETACAETQLGTFPDYTNESGFGICQFDEVGFNHAKERSGKYQDKIYDKWGVNVDIIQLIELRYNVFLSFLFCRLFYKSIPQTIPDTREERAMYWKRHYNTMRGKGSVKHYLVSCENLIGEQNENTGH